MSASNKQMIAFWLHRRSGDSSIADASTKDLGSAPKCSVYHFVSLEGEVLSSILLPMSEGVEIELSKIILFLQVRKQNIRHIESRTSRSSSKCIYLEIVSGSITEWKTLRNSLETLVGVEIDFLLARNDLSQPQLAKTPPPKERDANWFPRTISELDDFQNVLMYGTELDSDHPGFVDASYRRRRNVFAQIAFCYKHGQPIPHVKYSAEETRTWRAVFEGVRPLMEQYAPIEFKNNWHAMEQEINFGAQQIPQLQSINEFLQRKSGFQVRPVAGYLSPRDFLSGLAFRVFHCTQYIRHASDPFYTPEPDCCHEILGHIPMLADPEFASFSQEIGLASLGSSNADLQRLASCYFFSIEFGLCVEQSCLKVYGAGLMSSIAELKHVVGGIRDGRVAVQPFVMDDVINTPCMVTSFQKRYFYTTTIKQARNELSLLAKSVNREFDVVYDPYTRSIETIPKDSERSDD